MANTFDRVQLCGDKWFFNLRSGHTIDGPRACLKKRWPVLESRDVFSSVSLCEAADAVVLPGVGLQIPAEEILCCLFGVENPQQLMEKSLQEGSGESWLQRMQKRREQVPACLQSVNPLDGGCIFVTLGTNSRITLDLHELDGYTTYQVLRNPMVSSQVRTDGSRLLFGGGVSLSVGELFWLLMKGPQGPRARLM